LKPAHLNHIGVATPSIADSIVFYRKVMGDPEKIAERNKEYEDPWKKHDYISL
jgi:hypothetical protein